ncbi:MULTISPECIES: MBL fold metallo-hydrolase [unclassified Rhodococcus (in: high G+C Gram-positive bacteria)]|uniref:MBL fold metallo-hydrolase n=1 Tax=unclassified Rhodococcus (in: high G+C Gram-positive bacteria) TaxID=192944 RepID=UPI001639FC5C|nr:MULTISPECIES: MBL fold metallo-hydrolase [unclassified Rhodococcus (in: high G+C Gram-positive bacteria)]MBC2644000.1 MBL fold metallo-hydrolase [Rhodococcus sp. 3A]MBC2891261.1 MBL fold metallo-hydrolase [Rhodococcus sp. 4CII]
MLVTGFPAGMFQTNCYILAQDDAQECVVVDPGQDAAEPLFEFLDQSNLTPTAVLLTHGHLDHVWNAYDVCEKFGIPAYIHPEDRYMLSDPGRGIGPTMKPFIEGMTFVEPSDVIALADGDVIEQAGMSFSVDHTPGHTQGSVIFRTRVDTGNGPVEIALTGDTLFQGSIGRSDLPGGNHEQLLQSIADKLLILADDTAVLPGHGGSSTVGAERGSNPFLVGLSGSK